MQPATERSWCAAPRPHRAVDPTKPSQGTARFRRCGASVDQISIVERARGARDGTQERHPAARGSRGAGRLLPAAGARSSGRQTEAPALSRRSRRLRDGELDRGRVRLPGRRRGRRRRDPGFDDLPADGGRAAHRRSAGHARAAHDRAAARTSCERRDPSRATSSCRPSAPAGAWTISSSAASAGCRAPRSAPSSRSRSRFPTAGRHGRVAGARAARSSSSRPAPVEPAVPRRLRRCSRGRHLHRDRQAGRAAHPHHREVLAQHADRGAARALPGGAAAGLPPHRSRDLGRAAHRPQPHGRRVLKRAFARRRSTRGTWRWPKGCPPPTGRIDRR